MNTQASAPSAGTGPGGTPGGTPSGAPDAGHGSPPGQQFFDRIRALGVVRPDEGRWVAGVCAGLARRWALDPLLVRGLFVVVSIVSGFGLGLYGLLWLFLPHPDGRIHAQQVLRGVVTAGFVGSVIFILVDLPLSGTWAWNGHDSPFGGLPFLIVLGVGIWWFLGRRGRHGHRRGGPANSAYGPPAPDDGTPSASPPTSPTTGGPESETSAYGSPPGFAGTSGPAGPPGYAPPAAGYAPYAPYAPPASTGTIVTGPSRRDLSRPLHALTLATLGVALVAAGGVLSWDRWIGDVPDPGYVAAAVALGVVALGVVAAGLAGRRPGGLAPIAIVLAVAAANGAAWQGSGVRADETVSWTPTTTAAATSGYNLSTGRAVLDLTTAGLTTGATTAWPVTVPASLGAGELVVIVPSGVSTRVNAGVGLGAISDRVSGSTDRGGPNVTETVTTGTNPVLVVDAKVGLGHIEIVTQGTEVAR